MTDMEQWNKIIASGNGSLMTLLKVTLLTLLQVTLIMLDDLASGSINNLA